MRFLLCLSLLFSSSLMAESKPLKALYITEYGNLYHAYEKQAQFLKDKLPELMNVELTVIGHNAMETLQTLQKPDFSRDYDLIIYNACLADSQDSEAVENVIQQVETARKPIVFLHCAMHNFRFTSAGKVARYGAAVEQATAAWDKSHPGVAFPRWSQLTGMDSSRHELPGPLWIKKSGEHPVTQNLSDSWISNWDELYVAESLQSDVVPLYSAGRFLTRSQTVAWVRETSGGRVFATTLGHNFQTLKNKDFLALLQRGILWTVYGLADDGSIKPGFESQILDQ
ncbi:MAG: ThuA domain-containing protein [Oligoflexus sp.]|nr:ThuA domain-containing protein [Oligoflexus sp.]